MIEIIYEDNDIIVINKPPQVSATRDRAGQPDLLELLAEQIGPQPTKLRLVHRIDKDTTGVMIVARRREVQKRFAEYFLNRHMRKTYLALVRGAVMNDQGTIRAPLGRYYKNSEMMCVNRRWGKESLTTWRLLADFGLVSLLAAWPLTGRTHQIRVHLASIGLPLAIDPLYGGREPIMLSDYKSDYRISEFETEKPLIDRLTLHAYQIELPESEVGKPRCFIARLEKKFAATVKMLTKHNSRGPGAFINRDDYTAIMTGQPLHAPDSASSQSEDAPT